MTLKQLLSESAREFDEKFPAYLTPICPVDGTPVPIYNGWWVFEQGHGKQTLPQDIRKLLLSKQRAIIEAVRDELEKLYWCEEHQAMCDHAFDFCGLTDLISRLKEALDTPLSEDTN